MNADDEVDLGAAEYFRPRYQRSRDSGIYMYNSDSGSESESDFHDLSRHSAPLSPPIRELRRVPKGKTGLNGNHGSEKKAVIARKMWSGGEVRFEDQWGRRLVPVEGGRGEGFRFEIWPVEEEDLELEEGMKKGGWVKGR